MHAIRLRGARTHNLKGVSLDLHAGELTCVTGPSGAGKSSLALDTLYAEGQRRFVESFSPYARQFLERLERPPMDSLEPVAATIAVDRRAPIKSSRSTLATMTDLEPYLAALFAREAVPRCPDCDVPAVRRSAAQIATELGESLDRKRVTVTYAARAATTEAFLDLRERLLKDGYRRVVVGRTSKSPGETRDLDEVAPSMGSELDVITDRVAASPRETRRLQQALEAAWERGDGRARVLVEDGAAIDVARGLVCPKCARTFEAPRPGLFSYSSPLGACPTCRGFGRVIDVDWGKVVPDGSKSLAKGAIKAWNGKSADSERRSLLQFCARKGIPIDVAWDALTEGQRSAVIEGEGSWTKGRFPGVRAWFKWLETRTYKMHVRVFLARYREYSPCGDCRGSRLNANALLYQVGTNNLAQWHALTVGSARAALDQVAPHDGQGKVAHAELAARLAYLDAVGLGYLTLDRQARTLSGGEAQRAALTTALGTRMTGALFVLDEPTVGLHASDVPRLGEAIRSLADAGNAVLAVEHDETIARAADRVVEMGPGAGKAGGTILFDGPPAALGERPDLPTGRAWSGRKKAARPRRAPKGSLVLRGAKENNLQGVDVSLGLGVVTAITGPSGSGKSTLVEDVLFRATARALGDTSAPRPGAYRSLTGESKLARAVLVDQAPLGRTARGNAATYTKAWDRIRARFAAEGAAKHAGLLPQHFSFNVAGAGRCETCAGEGYETVEMQFLADVQLLCPVCRGQRFKPEVLAVRHRGLSVADVLAMTIDEALVILGGGDEDADWVLRRALEPVASVGLGYLPLGQPLSTLSGGEAQRLKLARALAGDVVGTLFVVDEPSAGLHPTDTESVISALHGLAARGATVVVVEHDLEVIASADQVIDLGPGAGPDGGRVVASGTPEQVAASGTKTGQVLAAWLAGGRARGPAKRAPRASSGGDAPAAIVVERAREHNLKGISCSIPHGSLSVVTGPSGSGKSSLAFDVIFAEGQRRFLETLTPYARQFLPTLPRPDVDKVLGVPPSIALEQRLARAGANSTVATVTEVAHYLRLLFAKVGEVHCPKCDAIVAASSPDELYEGLVATEGGVRHTIYAPAVRARKGTYLDLFTSASRAGVQAARVDGAIVPIDPPPRLKKTLEHDVDLIVHYGALRDLARDVFERALAWGNGSLRIAREAPTPTPGPSERLASTTRACSACGTGVPELDPRWFSFNTKQGQCEICEGTGLAVGAEGPDAPPCRACGGERLALVPRRVRLGGLRYSEIARLDVTAALAKLGALRFSGKNALIGDAPLAELLRRLRFVDTVGLGYLALGRGAATLSGGEMQRLRLAAQLGSGLTGALYVLDEPTIGLHPRDTGRLLANLRALVDTGSTVLVVEHDAETIAAADWVVDLGPSGGRGGGQIVAQGPAVKVLASESPTARALRDHRAAVPRTPRPMPDAFLTLKGASEHNLTGVDFRVPAGRLTVVCGVSGSGKSTLVRRVFYPALRRALGLVAETPGAHRGLTGTHVVKRALAVDQSPIGRTPRSVPATFLGIWDEIRALYANIPESKARGFGKARYSFNAAVAKGKKAQKGAGSGRCEGCNGQGYVVAEMSFLPDVSSPCETCGGLRFEPATLDVTYQGRSIGDVLRMSAEEAAELFQNHKRIAPPLRTLVDLGVGYLALGQGSNTLSGGEAQRLKLAAELTAGSAHEPTLYVLDEPTTGLHLSDVRKLESVLQRLVDRGDTLVVVEHHPDVIAAADWVVELGPEGGAGGGKIVYEGEPRKLPKAKTATGRFFADQSRNPKLGA